MPNLEDIDATEMILDRLADRAFARAWMRMEDEDKTELEERIAGLEALLRELMVSLQGVPNAREAQDYAQAIKNTLSKKEPTMGQERGGKDYLAQHAEIINAEIESKPPPPLDPVREATEKELAVNRAVMQIIRSQRRLRYVRIA